MTDFEFTFLLSGVDAHAEDFADRFFEAGCSDATLMLMRGLVAACFAREAENFGQAVLSAYRDVLKTGARIERFEPDFLVSRMEISKRAGLSKAAVSLYATGERGSGFPSPHARITSSNPLWDWVEVATWLHRNRLIPRESVINARISRAMNWHVQSHAKIRASEKALMNMMRAAEREAA